MIVGRGSQHFLCDRNDTLRVFLYAPTEAKVRRLRAEGMSGEEAEESVQPRRPLRQDLAAGQVKLLIEGESQDHAGDHP